MENINVIVYGCGVMGRRVAQALVPKRSLDVVGAIDIDPALVGKDLGELFDPSQETRIPIEKEAEDLLARVEAQAVVLTTTSHMTSVFPQVKQCVMAGLDVISTLRSCPSLGNGILSWLKRLMT